MSIGVILVHGYSGSRDDLLPLTAALTKTYGADSVRAVSLPGHACDSPLFDTKAFVASVVEAVQAFRKEHRRLVLLGHSTGGSIALSALAELSIFPELLVLASVPKKVDMASLERWSRHRAGKMEISFGSVANMVSLIKQVGARRWKGNFPVLVVHGEKDELVPVQDASAWAAGCFAGPVRSALIPGAGHDIFFGQNQALSVDAVVRAIADVAAPLSEEDEEALARIYSVEPEAKRFIERSPLSARHLVHSPSGRTAVELKPKLTPEATTEPIIANIEITTKCNLRCTHCARTLRGVEAKDMAPEMFRAILDSLPHAYRITLVGLGETLLHPHVVDFVAEASSRGRRVALVTNGMMLDEGLSRELLDAGLESIAFSVDGATQEIASLMRPGAELETVVGNIKRFVELSKTSREISTAVFSAVSSETVSSLGKLIEVVSGLGVHVMMLSDLNFRENLSRTLWKNVDDKLATEVRTGVAQAFKKGLPVLSVRGLEEFGLWKRYNKFLLLPPDQLYLRSSKHAWCFSPWQTIPVNVRGEVTLCDCQPEITAGNLLAQPFYEIWNNEVFKNHRSAMLSDSPPEACRICPRF